MNELFITSENFFSVYLKDLNVPIAYIILTISVLFICYKKHIPILRTLIVTGLTVPSVASILDVVYDYQIKIFVFHNMGLGEGLLFLLFPVSFYALSFYLWKYGDIKKTLHLFFPITYEVFATYLNTTIFPTVNYTPFIRYFYVIVFIIIILGLKKVENKKTIITES